MTVTKAKKKAWSAFSTYVRMRDWSLEGGQYIEDRKSASCVTCNKMYPVEGKGTMQAGHFIPGRNNYVLFDEEQVNSQCYNCNINLKGNWTAYYKVMVERHGIEKVTQMIDTHKTPKQYKVNELLELEKEFKIKTQSMLK